MLACILVLAITPSAMAENSVDKEKILSVLNQYETALNANDVEGVLSLYAENGVFMPQHSLPHIGKADIRKAYLKVFAAIDLDIDFKIDEIERLSDKWAFARTRSEGTVVLRASGVTITEGNQELFLLQKDSAETWKIARYIFSTTHPRAPK